MGDSGTIVTSPDGINWASQTNSPATPNSLYAIAWGNNEFVAVGGNGWTVRSANGTNWISSSSATVNDLYSIVFTGSGFLAVGENGTIIEAPWGVAAPQLGPIVLVPGTTEIDVTVRGTTGATYLIQESTDLVNWTLLDTLTLSGTNQAPFVDSAVGPRRFYRAVTSP